MALIDAAYNGDAVSLRKALNGGGDPNERNKSDGVDCERERVSKRERERFSVAFADLTSSSLF
jgi:hypothetical protein